jgi:hypothetical protein
VRDAVDLVEAIGEVRDSGGAGSRHSDTC